MSDAARPTAREAALDAGVEPLVPGGGGHPALGLDGLVADVSPATVRDALHEVIDPEIGLDIVELGLLRAVAVEDGVASIRFTVTTPACPLSSYIEDEIRATLWQLPGVREIEIAVELDPPWKPDDMSERARAALGWDG